MFIVTEFTASRPKFYRQNDVKDIRDLVIGITDSEKEANRAYREACDMEYGGIFTANKYIIECVHEGGTGIYE